MMSREQSTVGGTGRRPRTLRRFYDESARWSPEAPPSVSACPECGASHRRGRWSWREPPADARPRVCPACARIAAGRAAGTLHVHGAFVAAHRDELLCLLRNLEETERAAHPLRRILAVQDEERGFTVTTTDPQLVDVFARALKSAHRGHLERPAAGGGRGATRVRWTRD